MSEIGHKLDFFPFFELPRKIRDHILSYCCGDEHVLSSGWREPSYPPWWNGITVWDLQASRRFFDEAISMFYANSELMFEAIIAFNRLLDTLPIVHQNSIQKLQVRLSADEVEAWRTVLKEKASSHLPSLRIVNINVKVGTLPSWDRAPLSDLRFSSSNSLPNLRKAEIRSTYGIAYGYWAKQRGKVYTTKQLEYVERLFRGLAEALQ